MRSWTVSISIAPRCWHECPSLLEAIITYDNIENHSSFKTVIHQIKSRTFPEVKKKILQYLKEPYLCRISGRLKYKSRNFDQEKYLLSLAMGSSWEQVIISLRCSCSFCFLFLFPLRKLSKKTNLLWYFFS